jgi:hypothetical protein
MGICKDYCSSTDEPSPAIVSQQCAADLVLLVAAQTKFGEAGLRPVFGQSLAVLTGCCAALLQHNVTTAMIHAIIRNVCCESMRFV